MIATIYMYMHAANGVNYGSAHWWTEIRNTLKIAYPFFVRREWLWGTVWLMFSKIT